MPPLQPGLRRPLQPARSPADPRRGEEVPVWHLLPHLQPHVTAAETQLLRVLRHGGLRRRGGQTHGLKEGAQSEFEAVRGPVVCSRRVDHLQGLEEHDMASF